MAIANGVILCLAFIVGLLSSQVSWSGYGLLGLGVALAIASRNKRWHRVSLLRKPAGVWLVAGLIGLLAHFYVQMRTPTPLPNDISRWMTDTKNESALVTVQGTIQSPPRLTRSQRVQLWPQCTTGSGNPNPRNQSAIGSSASLKPDIPKILSNCSHNTKTEPSEILTNLGPKMLYRTQHPAWLPPAIDQHHASPDAAAIASRNSGNPSFWRCSK